MNIFKQRPNGMWETIALCKAIVAKDNVFMTREGIWVSKNDSLFVTIEGLESYRRVVRVVFSHDEIEYINRSINFRTITGEEKA